MKTILILFMLTSPFLCIAREVPASFVCPPCGNGCDDITYSKEGLCPICGMQLVEYNKTDKKSLTICFYLQEGVEILDFAGPMEVFSHAGAKIFTVSKKKNPIISQGILKIMPDYDITDAPTYDILAVFGGNATKPSEDPELISWIKSKQNTTKYYFSVCTGAFILGKAGLLDNLTVTTFHESLDGLRTIVPTAKVLPNTRFVDNGTVITTAGISAGIDGALHLVEKLGGKELAEKVVKYMEYDKWIPSQGLVIDGKIKEMKVTD